MHFNILCDRLKDVTQETTALKEYDLKHKSQILKIATAARQVIRNCLFPNHFPQKKSSIFVHIIDCTQSTINSFCPESLPFPMPHQFTTLNNIEKLLFALHFSFYIH